MVHDLQDKATAIRKGEELDVEVLRGFLEKELDCSIEALEIKQFPSGFSNLTYLVKFSGEEYVLRRPPFGVNIKSGHDMGREYKILRALSKSYGRAPKPLIYTEDESIMGASFYMMERVNGIILRAKNPAEFDLSAERMQKVSDAMVEAFVDLHQVDYEAVGLADLGKPEGYAERQIIGWTRRYAKAKTDDIPLMDGVANWLNAAIPSNGKSALIHNDYKYDNIVLDLEEWGKVIAILDWEMSTLGDPLMDLGSSLGYTINHDDPDWMKKLSFGPSSDGCMTRDEFANKYGSLSGNDTSNVVYYYVYGLFKLAVITQQIYYRYAKGFTKDERFKELIKVVHGLSTVASQAIEKNRLDRLF